MVARQGAGAPLHRQSDRREERSRQSLVDGKISSLISTIVTRGIKRSYKQQNIYIFKRCKFFTCIENLL